VSAWLVPVILAAAGLVWLETRRPNRSHLASRVACVVIAAGALVLLLALRTDRGPVTLLTPGAPITARSRGSVALEEAQSLADLGERHPSVRLAGWGLLAHEWPDSAPPISGFDRTPLPDGIVRIDAPTEVGAGERLVVRGSVSLDRKDAAEVVLEDPSGPCDSARVTGDQGEFELSDRPRVPGAAAYRLQLRRAGHPERAETLGVAVRQLPMPSILVLDASPSFETGALKRWLAERGAGVTVRTAISRDRFRTEGLNRSPSDMGRLTAGGLGRFDAVLADGGSIAALGSGERETLEREIRVRGLGLLITADGPSLLGQAPGGVLSGFTLEPIEVASVGPKGRGDRRVARPVLPEAPRQSRTGIDADAASLKLATAEPVIRDELGRVVSGWRRAGVGRVGVTLLRSPSRWLLEGEPELYAAYWYAMLRAVTRDTTTKVLVSAEGPLRADHPVTITLDFANPPESAESPVAVVKGPDGRCDSLALAQDPFDPARYSGRYWPRSAGWHSVALRGDRRIPFRVTHPGEWMGVEASARLTATLPRIASAMAEAGIGTPARAWLGPLAFVVLLLSLVWLWIEARQTA
jgi:hypothetical protein